MQRKLGIDIFTPYYEVGPEMVKKYVIIEY